MNVVDTRAGSLESDETVVMSGNKIKSVNLSKSAPLPSGTRVIDCRGDYLIPGLWDMHVHSEGDPQVLGLLLAAGITGARDIVSSR